MRVRRHFSEQFKEDYIDPTMTPKLPDQNLGRKPDEGTKLVIRSLRLKYRGSSTGEGKRLKTKELGRKLEEGAKPSVKSLRLISKGASLGKYRKPRACKKESGWRLIAESALRDYNKKHGTDLELVRLLDDKIMGMWGPGYTIDFTERYTSWKHFNFEARSRNADPSDKPFLLFAEVYEKGGNYCLTTLSPVNLTDKAYGCQSCWSYISHPRYGCHAGFDTSVTAKSKILSRQVAVDLLKKALQDYNEKNGTNVQFESALEWNSFICEGLLMDLSKRNTSWVHVNFYARVGPEEKVICLFGELYLDDDGKYVLATLSVAEPSDAGRWKNILVHGCRFCPEAICHPWRGYGYSFNYPPIVTPPDIILKARGVDFRNNFQSKSTTSKKRLKSPNKELGQKREEETAQSCKKHKALGEVSVPIKWNELAESALRDYNEKHGTDLEFVRLLHKKFSYGRCYSVDFAVIFKLLKFCTFEARPRNDVPFNEPLLLFAEVYEKDKKNYLNKFSLVKLEDDDNGSLHYHNTFVRYIAYPRYGFRGGLDTLVSSKPKMLSKQDAAKLSKFALQDYNAKHGTNLKFERALKCNSFTCAGLLMDFKEKYTSWVHMNFEARVGPKEEVVCLFGELCLGDDDMYKLATLSVADMGRGGKWKTRTSESECAFCPNDICHPPYSYLYTFSKLPSSTD